MSSQAASPARGQDGARFVGFLVLLGILAGIVLWLLTNLVTRSNISGNGWSLSGNGALIVPFGLGPAIVAGGWAAIILRMRGHPRWLQLGIGSGLVGLALVAASLLSLIVFGPRGRNGIPPLWLPALRLAAGQCDHRRDDPRPRSRSTGPAVLVDRRDPSVACHVDRRLRGRIGRPSLVTTQRRPTGSFWLRAAAGHWADRNACSHGRRRFGHQARSGRRRRFRPGPRPPAGPGS